MWVPHPGEVNERGFQAGHYTCGQTAAAVKDRFGIDRAICADHYLRGIVSDRKMPNQDIVDRDGRYDVAAVKAHWQALELAEKEKDAKRARISHD